MQSTRFDFDVITGPVPPKPAPLPAAPSGTGTSSAVAMNASPAVANPPVSRHKAG